MALRNTDYSDREMLLVITEVLDDDGVASSQAVAERLGIGPKNGRQPGGRVSSRLSWMARLKQLERIDPKSLSRKRSEVLWAITPHGEEVLKGGAELPKQVRKVLDRGLSSRMALMRELSRAGYADADDLEASAIRREWLHGAAQRMR